MSSSYQYIRLSKSDAACLLVDHQSGLISLGLGALFSDHIPNYRNLITSYLAKK